MEVRRWVTSALIVIAAIAGLVLVAGPSSAHASAEHGELTFHDSEDGEPTSTVECEFWIRGHDMTFPNGTIEIRQQLGSADSHSHELANWTGEENANGTFDFELGPIDIHSHGDRTTQVHAELNETHDSDTYRIEHTECEDDERPLPGNDPRECDAPPEVQAHADEGAILVSWTHHQDPEQTAHYRIHRSPGAERNFSTIATVDANQTSYRDARVTPGSDYIYTVTAVDAETGREGRACDHARETATARQTIPCPADVRAEARDDGDIALSWKPSENATGYHVHRASEGTGFAKIAEVEQTTFVDGETEAETTYVYRVTAVNGTRESGNCGVVEATAIPTFPTWMVVGATALAGVGALVLVRRRRG